MYRKIFFIIMLIASFSYAANFGSAVKLNHLSVRENQTAQFSLLLWTADDAASKVIFDVLNKPENFSVAMEREIQISRNIGNEMVYAQEYIHATSVKISVDPHGSGPGSYNISIAAKMVSDSGGINFAQERIFNLVLEIEGKRNVINIEIPETHESRNNYNFPLAILIIIFISFLIYKYS